MQWRQISIWGCFDFGDHSAVGMVEPDRTESDESYDGNEIVTEEVKTAAPQEGR